MYADTDFCLSKYYHRVYFKYKDRYVQFGANQPRMQEFTTNDTNKNGEQKCSPFSLTRYYD